ncbi:Concentrative nucleoside transporter C-terminal domain-containing protein [Plasmodiophora brassicae]
MRRRCMFVQTVRSAVLPLVLHGHLQAEWRAGTGCMQICGCGRESGSKSRCEQPACSDMAPVVDVPFDDADKPVEQGAQTPRTRLLLQGVLLLLFTAYVVVLAQKDRSRTHPDAFAVIVAVYAFALVVVVVKYTRRLHPSSLSQVPFRRLLSNAAGRLVPTDAARHALLLTCTLAAHLVSAFLFALQPGTTIWMRLQSVAGVVAFLALMFAVSKQRMSIDWHTVSVGLFLQYVIAMVVFRTRVGFEAFRTIARVIVSFLSLSHDGTAFLIGSYTPTNFVLHVFPAVIFFCAFIQVLYYWGYMQAVVEKVAYVTRALMRCSGCEAVVAAASPFVGQGESAMLVRPFVEYATVSEVHSMMTSGFATIAGSVLMAYIAIGIDANILLTSCIMSIPTSLLLSKMRLPSDTPMTRDSVSIPHSPTDQVNVLHAAAIGAATGVQIVLLIAGSILAIVSLFAAVNAALGTIFTLVDVVESVNAGGPHPITIQFLLSYVFAPFAWLMGVPAADARLAGEILASKMLVNEFVGYTTLIAVRDQVAPRTFQIMSFALCGFANLASMGMQIGTLTVMAPTRSADFAHLALSAMLTGTVSTWLSAAVVGIIL